MVINDALPYVLLGLLTWSVLLYLIISLAVKSGTNSQVANQKLILRMKIKQMLKQGFTYREIYDLHIDSEKEFWRKIAEESARPEDETRPLDK
jgi:hypothetical protein